MSEAKDILKTVAEDFWTLDERAAMDLGEADSYHVLNKLLDGFGELASTWFYRGASMQKGTDVEKLIGNAYVDCANDLDTLVKKMRP